MGILMEKNESLANAGYLIGALLFIVPLADALLRVLPTQFGNERWRFQVLGGLSSLTLVPLIGLLVGLLAASYIGSARVRRSIGILCVALAVLFLIVVALFIADFLNVRSTFPPNVQHPATVATTVAAVKLFATIIVLALLGLAGMNRTGYSRG